MIRLENKRIAFFDYLRALAILFVVVAHHRLENIPGGSIGVSIFFCLSGFLITTLLLENKSLDAAEVWRFITRRFLRVYPAYFVTLVLLLLFMVTKHNSNLSDYISALPGLLTFTTLPQKWLGMGTGVLWTLHVEFWFYVTLPLVILLLGRGKAFVVLCFCFIATSWTLKYLAITGTNFVGSPIQFLLWSDTLFYGALVAVTLQSDRFHLPRWACGGMSIVCLVGVEAIALYVPNTDLTIWLVEASAGSLLTAGMIAAHSKPLHTVPLFPLAWFGRISYSIYLLHAISLDYGWAVWPLEGKNIRRFAVVTACVLILHYFVEKPGIRFGHRLTAKRSSSVKSSITAASP